MTSRWMRADRDNDRDRTLALLTDGWVHLLTEKEKRDS